MRHCPKPCFNTVMTLNPVTDAFVTELQSHLPGSAIRSVEPRYLEEPRGAFHGQLGAVVAPGSVADVASVVRLAGQARVGLVPYSGGTGLVGGQTMPDGPAPLLLSLERMTKIRDVLPSENILIAEAGAILQDVQTAAEYVERLFPLSLASEGSCRIGGNLATNAGGVNVLRYGNARDLCLGLEAVLPDGQIWHGLKRLRKDNTGYDLRDLLIGAEGTLGVITAATLRLFPRPERQGAAFMVVPDPTAALALLVLASHRIGEGISAFELIYRTGLQFLTETMPQVRQPFEDKPEWMVLIDLGLSGAGDPDQALGDLFEAGVEAGIVLDGVIAQSVTQRQEFWSLRESMPEANKRIGAIASTDIALPTGALAAFIEKAKAAVEKSGDFRINCFGHLGDGNLHYNVFPALGRAKPDYPGAPEKMRRIIHDLVAEFGGSFSAEHGIGRLKVGDLERYGDPAKLSAMRAIKAALDPLGIMNPGAVLRQQI